jgi:hypothetical protein
MNFVDSLPIRLIFPKDRTLIAKETSEYFRLTKRSRIIWIILLSFALSFRIIGPFYIFRYPLYAFLFVSFIDWIDFIPYMKLGIRPKTYQEVDKIFDIFSYFFMVAYAYGSYLFPLFVGLLVYRLIGTVVFYLTKSHSVFLIFPNMVEPVFLSYVISKLYFGSFISLFVLFFILKMLQEILLHFICPNIPLIILFIKIRNKEYKYILHASTKVEF